MMNTQKSDTEIISPAPAKRSRLFGLLFERVNLQQAGEQIIDLALNRQKALIVSPNVDHIVCMERDVEMRNVFLSAKYCYADGMPLVWISQLGAGPPLPERVTGADLLPKVCELACKHGLASYFLGGQPGEAQLAAEHLRARHPGLKISGVYCPPMGFEQDPAESARIVAAINALRPDILFVGVGAPKQEKWAARHLTQLDVGPVLGVGAAFAFCAGTIKRAPIFFQKSGLEWLWRLAQEPKRLWRRYLLRDLRFIRLAINELRSR